MATADSKITEPVVMANCRLSPGVDSRSIAGVGHGVVFLGTALVASRLVRSLDAAGFDEAGRCTGRARRQQVT